MANPTDYLIAAAVSLMRSADNSALETIDDLKEVMETQYSVTLVPERLEYLARQLERLGFIQVVNDTYAGDYITPPTGWGVTYRLNKIRDAEPRNGITYALDRGSSLLERAFSNPQFWADLDSEIEAAPQNYSNDVSPSDLIPAADRLVSISHNQFKEIESPTSDLIDALEADNGLPDEPGIKEKILGQIKAGRELVRAGIFELGLFQLTMVVGLKLLIEKYKDHIIAALAAKLLDLLVEQIPSISF